MARTSAQKKSTGKPELCPECGGTGVLYVPGSLDAKRCVCGAFEEDLLRRRLALARIPARFAEKSFETFEVARGDSARRQIRNTAMSFATTFDPTSPETDKGLRLHGSVGSGKTHIAVAILREVIRRGYSGIYYNFSDLLDDLRGSFNEKNSNEGWRILEDVEQADLLVLDDIGAESTTDWVRDRLYLIVNRRYENGKALIITTNLDFKDLDARVGPRTMSRFMEMCDEFVPFPKDDWRRRQMR
ncbi:MAG: ATP-binding protein [Sumerlaeia bacterium]